MKLIKSRVLQSVCWPLVAACLALSALSIAILCSVAEYGRLNLGGQFGSYKPAYTQIFAVVLGFAAMLAACFYDYRRLVEIRAFHAVCWGLVLLTFLPGIGYEPPGTGSFSWIALPLGMSFQPTEIAKISFLLTFAHHLAKARGTLNRPRTLAPVLAHLAAPALLVHFQGDDGTATVFLAMGGVMLVAAGLNRWVVASIAGASAAAAPFIWRYALPGYQRGRILGLLNPGLYADGIMYQQLQARAAIEGGGLLGRGLFGPLHHYVPRSENDFIFSYFAESCGFFGGLALIGLLGFAMLYILRVAQKSLDATGAFVCVGVFAALLYQTVINLGMNLMLLPVMGVTLPFISAGGTSVLMLYLAVGLVLSVGRVATTAAAQNLPGAPPL